MKKVIRIEMEEGKGKWAKTTRKYLQLVGLGMYELAQKKKEVKQVKKWDTDQWEEEVNSKNKPEDIQEQQKEYSSRPNL